MIHKFLYASGPFLILLFAVETAAADRITLHAGDIFICNIMDQQDNRYIVDRFPFHTIIPKWTIKKIERGTDTLPSDSAVTILSETQMYQLGGSSIAVKSVTPAETSHLELYPQREHFWIEKERYLRGYLVNRGNNSYKQLEVCFRFYSIKGTITGQVPTVIYEVYPQTMKPFIINTSWVEWNTVSKIVVETIGRVPFKKPYP